MSEHYVRFCRNIGRVDSLKELFERAKKTPGHPTVKEADILRAAVVFLHSALEDYFRGVLSQWIPIRGNEKTLDSISLLGTEGRVEKFLLGSLKAHSQMKVSDLVTESVRQHLQKVSFNNYTDICSWARKIGLDLGEFHDQELINNMIKRRHMIVHEADANQSSGRGNHKAASINSSTVSAWETATTNLVKIVEKQIVVWES